MSGAKPAIIMGAYDGGRHNESPRASAKRVKATRVYEDVSTVCVIPTRGAIPARVVEAWWGMMTPMNHKFIRIMMRGMEVGAAYNQAVQLILDHPDLSNWKYVLTLEEDNMPPPDGLLKLIEAMGKNPQYDAIGGLYWTKGEEGMPMIYGDPKLPLAFNPQVPRPDQMQECNGLGMGFTLFRMEMFKKLPPPWFVTKQEWSAKGTAAYTQDLYFFEHARKAGMRVASDNSVKVGHYSVDDDIIW